MEEIIKTIRKTAKKLLREIDTDFRIEGVLSEETINNLMNFVEELANMEEK